MYYNQILPPSKLLNRDSNFIGRKEYLEKIESAFTKENKQVVILSSFSGTGKSSIANEICHRFNDSSLNQLVYWMKADEFNLDDKFRQFAFDLKVITENEKIKMQTKFIIDRISSKLKSDHMDKRFLFILDDCDSTENTKDYLNLIMKDSTLKNIKFFITTIVGSPIDEFDSDTRGKIRNLTETVLIESFKENETIEFIKTNRQQTNL